MEESTRETKGLKGLTVLCFLTQFQWVIQGMKNGRIYLRNKRVEGVKSSVLSHSEPMGDSGDEKWKNLLEGTKGLKGLTVLCFLTQFQRVIQGVKNGRIYLKNKRVEGVNSSVLPHSVPMGDSGDEKWKNLLEKQKG